MNGVIVWVWAISMLIELSAYYLNYASALMGTIANTGEIIEGNFLMATTPEKRVSKVDMDNNKNNNNNKLIP